MTSEHEPTPNPLETTLIHGHSLAYWQAWLVHDHNGEYYGNDAVPASRYGDDGAECSWWALAGELAYTVHCGDSEGDGEAALNYMMGLAVNDNPELAQLIAETWHDIPKALREHLGSLEEVTALFNTEGGEQ